jgi:hypothetical protein
MSFTTPVVNLNVTVECCNRDKPVVITKSFVGNNEQNNEDEKYMYKAKKYHNKCWLLIKNLLKEGRRCPEGYEKYLRKYES